MKSIKIIKYHHEELSIKNDETEIQLLKQREIFTKKGRGKSKGIKRD